MTMSSRRFDRILSDDLLTLAQGHVVEVAEISRELHFLSDLLDVLQWIDTRRQNEEDRSRVAAFFERLCKDDRACFDVFRSEFLADKFTHCVGLRRKSNENM